MATENGIQTGSMTGEWLRTAFLVGNPQSFGFIPDAYPVATGRILIAANGHAAERGERSPLLELESTDPTVLLQDQYRMLENTRAASDILRMTFCEMSGEHQEFPLARCCAVLCEAEAYHVLAAQSDTTPYVTVRTLLAARLSGVLESFRDTLNSNRQGKGGLAPVDDAFFRVSFGACRVLPGAGTDEWIVDIFSAGDFSVYILDRDGLSPLWTTVVPPLSVRDFPGMSGRSIRIRHTGRFAILLLSDSVCAPIPAERHAITEHPSLIWQHRMRTEERLLGIIDRAPSVTDFAESATRVLAGRATGRDSASGAMTVLGDLTDRSIRVSSQDREAHAYSAFRKTVSARLTQLGETVSLLNSYDPDRLPPVRPCLESERRFAVGLLMTRPMLAARCEDLLKSLADRKLTEAKRLYGTADAKMPVVTEGESGDDQPLPPVPTRQESGDPQAPEDPISRLSAEDVWSVFRSVDQENDADRDRIEKNRRFLRDCLCDHWVTLRPLLCGFGQPDDPDGTAQDAIATAAPSAETTPPAEAAQPEPSLQDQSYIACVALNRRLSAIKHEREALLDGLHDLLTRALKTLEDSSADWVMGRTDPATLSAWTNRLTGQPTGQPSGQQPHGGNDAGQQTLPDRLTALKNWESDTDAFRRLQAEYQARREALFAADTEAGSGIFAEDFTRIMSGALPAVTWERYRAAADRMPEYARLIDVLRTVSDRTGELLHAIAQRNADRRCTMRFAGMEDWKFAAIRAAVYADPDWNDADLIDEGTRNEYRSIVRRWREEQQLRARQNEAWESYRMLYTIYDEGARADKE